MTAEEALAWLAAAPSETAIFTDFDGTVSAIVPAARDARPVPGSVSALYALASIFSVVAVVSGRPVAFLVAQLGLHGPGRLHAYGLHGVEHTTGDGVDLAPGAEQWRPAVAAVTSRRAELEAAGVSVEDKEYGVTLHWRQAADPVGAEAEALSVVGSSLSSGLLQRPGKKSVELVLPVGVDKGTVVADWIARGGLSRLAYLGDDLSDVLAFDAIDAASASGVTEGLKLAVSSDEAPKELLDKADVVLGQPADAVSLLVRLAARVGA
ncbi:MAG: trehalose-phosphatase [Acidimicrobiales bacterium]